MRNKRQILGEWRDYTYRSTHISAANRPKIEHLIPNYCFDALIFIMIKYAIYKHISLY